MPDQRPLSDDDLRRHDDRTDLTAIRVNADLMYRRLQKGISLDTEDAAARLKAITEHVDRMVRRSS